MTRFRFSLEKVLAWRRTELELAEIRLKQQAAAAAAIERARAGLQAEGIRTETEVRQWESVSGRDLEALAEFRRHVRARDTELAAQAQQACKLVAERQAAMLEARRRCRLLERLKERRLAEWKKAEERELEQLAGEAYLARWAG